MEVVLALLVVGGAVWWYFARNPLAKEVKETLVTPQKDEVPYKVETPVVEKSAPAPAAEIVVETVQELPPVEAKPAKAKKPAAKKTAGAKPAAKKAKPAARTAKPKKA